MRTAWGTGGGIAASCWGSEKIDLTIPMTNSRPMIASSSVHFTEGGNYPKRNSIGKIDPSQVRRGEERKGRIEISEETGDRERQKDGGRWEKDIEDYEG